MGWNFSTAVNILNIHMFPIQSIAGVGVGGGGKGRCKKYA